MPEKARTDTPKPIERQRALPRCSVAGELSEQALSCDRAAHQFARISAADVPEPAHVELFVRDALTAGPSGGILAPATCGDVGPYRIAFAIQRYFEFGGLQRDMFRVADACRRLGHEVHVLTSEWRGANPSGIEVRLLDARALTNHGTARKFSYAVRRFLQTQKYDCVVGFSRMKHLDVYWCGDPCLDETLDDRKPGFLRWLPRYHTYLKLEKAVMRRRSRTELLVLCPQEVQRFMRRYRTDVARIHLLPPGIDKSRLRVEGGREQIRTDVRDELGIAPGNFVALTVGSSFHTKGVDRAIRALQYLREINRRDAALIVVGQGDRSPYLRLAKKLGVARYVHFTGGRHDVARFYRAADLLLHPARTETAGHSILEAMLCELPVLVTENCGYAHHVRQSGSGLICPVPFSQQALNHLAEQSLDDTQRQNWRQQAAAYCGATDMAGMVGKAVQVIVDRASKNRVLRLTGGLRRAT